jgi:Ca-activated chloride channel family protein
MRIRTFENAGRHVVWSVMSLSLASACESGGLPNASEPPPVGDNASVVVSPPYDSNQGSDPDDGEPNDDGNTYAEWTENDWIDVQTEPMSTFSADVDTASYSIVRRSLNEGGLPTPEAVRVEEMLNYFRYDEPGPPVGSPDAFAIHLEAGPSMFGGDDVERHLVRIGVAAQEVPLAERAPANIVFLVDVSGSMAGTDRLLLVKYALGQLVDKLSPSDTLGIVVYAGAAGVVLEPTPVVEKSVILDALDALEAGGSTAGGEGIEAAYALAASAMKADGINRVVLCTDGDFNVGLTGAPLVDLIEVYRDFDVFLSILGFGWGNLNDALIEDLTNAGNGNYAYIDSKNEALRVLGENLVGTLQVVAKDVKLQVEFDPATVARYRLIGYENRLLENDEFDDDTIDAGDMGAGHHMTALYEIELNDGAKGLSPSVPQETPLATLRVRHKKPTGDESLLTERPILLEDIQPSLDAVSSDYLWSMAVAELGEVLRDSMHVDTADFAAIRAVAQAHQQGSPTRQEFIELVDLAAGFSP